MSEAELYEGREQSLVKHRILRRYLQRFTYIIGSRWNSISYVDCFSGPWKSKSEQFADTSFAIAIKELRTARDTLAQQSGKKIYLRCLFLERNKRAYAQLSKFAGEIDDCQIETRNAKLEDSVDQIVAFIKKRRSFPFIFIDPTGWTGFALDIIQPLLRLNPEFFWLDETIEHLAEHGVTPEEFEEVVSNPEEIGESRSSTAGVAGEKRQMPVSSFVSWKNWM